MNDLSEFYSKNVSKYKIVANKIEGLIKELIDNENIQILSVNSRVKNLSSYLKKAQRYKNPKEEVMDYIGIRIITYVLNDMEKVSNIIKKEFDIDEDNSIDKSIKLGNDKMGYRSMHFIASINEKRESLAEYSICRDCFFEIQIRTIFQHSWAEIEHDKNYKYSGILPDGIKRRLNLLSAVLESVDNEFNTISMEIDNYVKNVSIEIEKNNLNNIELNSASLKEFITNKYSKYNLYKNLVNTRSEVKIINELKSFGIIDLKGIEDIMEQKNIDEIFDIEYEMNIVGFFRIFMMLNDAEKYFKYCYDKSWSGLPSNAKIFFSKFNPRVLDIIKNYDINIPD